MKITDDSHLDHSLTPAHVEFIQERFGDRGVFFIRTLELPKHLPSLPCGLHGPIMGDDPVPEVETAYAPRGDRDWGSRLCARPPRLVRQLTVIAGPYGDEPCVLYTAFGGPLAPREPGDPTLPVGDADESIAFWTEHALSDMDMETPLVTVGDRVERVGPAEGDCGTVVRATSGRALVQWDCGVSETVDEDQLVRI